MAQLPTITELALVGVADAGVPNRERVVLRPSERVDLSQFVLIAGVVQPNGAVIPLPNVFLWLGDLSVSPPSWIYVYTGPGQFHVTKITGTQQPVYVYHWGNAAVIFGQPNVVPALVRIDAIGFGGRGQTHAPQTADELNAFLSSVLGPPPAYPTINYGSATDDFMRSKDQPPPEGDAFKFPLPVKPKDNTKE